MALAKISKERTRIFSVRLIRILIENRFSLDKALGTIIKPIMLSKNEVVVSKIDKMRVEVKNPFSGVQLKSNHEKISDKSEEKKSISASFIETRRLLPKMIKQLIYKLIRRYFAAAIEQKKTPEVKTVSTAQATQTDLLSVQERLSPVVPVMLQYEAPVSIVSKQFPGQTQLSQKRSGIIYHRWFTQGRGTVIVA